MMKANLIAMAFLVLASSYGATLTVDGKKIKTIQAAVNAAKAGDTVLVMPGRYPESVLLKNSGTADKPIIIKSAEKWKAVIDCSNPVTGWKKAGSAADALNAANWKEIYYAAVPDGTTYQNANLYEDGKLCSIAQDPVPRDPFHYDDKEVFMRIDPKNYSATHITLPSYFTQKDPNYWDEAILMLWSANNNMLTPKIENYDPATGTLTFKKTGWPRPERDRFAMLNHVDLIKKPGDYVVRTNPKDKKKYIYFWPFDAKSLSNGSTTMSVRSNGINIGGKSFVEIRDFKITGSSGASIRNGAGMVCQGVVISGNEVCYARIPSGWAITGANLNDAIIENNYVHNIMHGRGIGISGNVQKYPALNATIRNNRVSRCGGTGINFYGVHGGKMIGNLVHDNRGHHGNGLTAYLGCKDIVIEDNVVFRSNLALTAQQGENFTIRNNYFIGNDPDTMVLIGIYGRLKNFVFQNNTVLDTKNALHFGKNVEGFVVTDNILPGLNIWTEQKVEGGLVIKNNLITRETEKGRDKIYRENNTYELDLSKVFVDAKNGDFTRIPGGPLPGAGAPGRKIDLAPEVDRN